MPLAMALPALKAHVISRHTQLIATVTILIMPILRHIYFISALPDCQVKTFVDIVRTIMMLLAPVVSFVSMLHCNI